MSQNGSSDGPPLRVLQILRAPVGGLFRHVRDLTRALAEAGHAVGVVADAGTGGAQAEAALAALAPSAELGLTRVAMPRDLGLGDAAALRHVLARARESGCDILHGHGAKGGAYARLAGTLLRRRGHRVARVYTPHGGSLHYDARSAPGLVYLTLERALRGLTDAAIFESAFGRDTYAAKVGTPPAAAPVVHNGLAEAEFEALPLAADAADFLFIGELRKLKGVDILLRALARLRAEGSTPSLLLVGAGPDEAAFRALAQELGLADRTRFLGPMPARQAFARARCVVIPSRAESLPYIVLEAAAAAKPLIATRVGGIPEIMGDSPDLVAPAESPLAQALRGFLTAPEAAAARAAARRDDVRRRFSVETMRDGVLAAYRSTLSGAGQRDHIAA